MSGELLGILMLVAVLAVIFVGFPISFTLIFTAVVFGLTDAKDKHLTKAEAGAFKKANVAAKRNVRELRCDEEFAGKFEVGAAVNLGEIFQPGQIVDAQGITRGRGFTGRGPGDARHAAGPSSPRHWRDCRAPVRTRRP